MLLSFFLSSIILNCSVSYVSSNLYCTNLQFEFGDLIGIGQFNVTLNQHVNFNDVSLLSQRSELDQVLCGLWSSVKLIEYFGICSCELEIFNEKQFCLSRPCTDKSIDYCIVPVDPLIKSYIKINANMNNIGDDPPKCDSAVSYKVIYNTIKSRTNIPIIDKVISNIPEYLFYLSMGTYLVIFAKDLSRNIFARMLFISITGVLFSLGITIFFLSRLDILNI